MADEDGELTGVARITTETKHAINVGGNYTWVVNDNLCVKVDKKTFVKFLPWDYRCVRLVTDGIVPVKELPKKADRSGNNDSTLSQCPGVRRLLELRNAAQARDLQPKGLFDVFTSAPSSGKGQCTFVRRPKNQPVESELSSTLVLQLPPLSSSFGELPEASLEMVRPLKRDSELTILLDADQIKHLVLFVRYSGGLQCDQLAQKRTWHRLSPEEKTVKRSRRYGSKAKDGEDDGDDDEEEGAAHESGGWWGDE